MNRHSSTLLLTIALVLVASSTNPAPAQDTSATALPDTTRLASDALARLALTALREIIDPTPDDYRLSALALRVARRAYPNDVELLRLEIDAWDAAGDQDSAIAGTRQLVRLNPVDDVAWLRIVNHNIRRLQNAEERLAAYDRLLGPDGRALDPSIRSRLALDAAQASPAPMMTPSSSRRRVAMRLPRACSSVRSTIKGYRTLLVPGVASPYLD